MCLCVLIVFYWFSWITLPVNMKVVCSLLDVVCEFSTVVYNSVTNLTSIRFYPLLILQIFIWFSTLHATITSAAIFHVFSADATSYLLQMIASNVNTHLVHWVMVQLSRHLTIRYLCSKEVITLENFLDTWSFQVVILRCMINEFLDFNTTLFRFSLNNK